MKPVRIQRKRAKGWKMPPNTVYVGRGSKWGNPFTFANSGNVHPALRFACEVAISTTRPHKNPSCSARKIGTAKDERELHKRFAAHHSYREWFRIEGAVLDFLRAEGWDV